MTREADVFERIGDAVEGRRGELIELIQELVRIPSLTGDEGAVQVVVAERMRALGLETDVWEPDAAELAPYAEHVGEFESLEGRPNVVGALRGSGGGKSLILNAHIDTVETGEPGRWTHPPFAGEIVNGRLFGRGACDMKAGLATHLIALAALADAGLRPRGDVIVQSVISEEDGGAGTLATILRGYRADGAIITEPTNLAVIPAQGGSLVFRLHVPGRSAHACVRDEGVSAIEKFAVLHRALIAFEAERNAAIDHPLYAHIANKIPINIGVVRAGAWPSSVPEWLIAEGRAGLVPGEDLDAFRREFVAVVDRAADADEWLRTERPRVEWFSGQFAPAEVPIDSPLVRAVAEAHREVTGDEAKLDAATYGADMRHFLLFGETPCVMYGAGDVRLAHFTDESVPIEDVVTATKTIALTIATWCGVDSSRPTN
ncbi:MAG: acetylornithine deacetylase [Thermomicrobiales bacterium]|nr:acetylornithine deacetylase [Thermomicrobiales bacterium]